MEVLLLLHYSGTVYGTRYALQPLQPYQMEQIPKKVSIFRVNIVVKILRVLMD